jgi:hypothetical protein
MYGSYFDDIWVLISLQKPYKHKNINAVAERPTMPHWHTAEHAPGGPEIPDLFKDAHTANDETEYQGQIWTSNLNVHLSGAAATRVWRI